MTTIEEIQRRVGRVWGSRRWASVSRP